jgi:hypothetical protein
MPKENIKEIKFYTELNKPGQQKWGKTSHQGLNGKGRNKNQMYSS